VLERGASNEQRADRAEVVALRDLRGAVTEIDGPRPPVMHSRPRGRSPVDAPTPRRGMLDALAEQTASGQEPLRPQLPAIVERPATTA